MKHEMKTWLFDILKSIEEIEGYFSEKPKRFEDYLSDTKTQRAVERNLEIIGEAVNRILKVDPEFKLENSHKIIGARNRIIHGCKYQLPRRVDGLSAGHSTIGRKGE